MVLAHISQYFQNSADSAEFHVDRPGIVSTQNPNSAESAEFLFDSSVETRGEERSQMLYWKK